METRPPLALVVALARPGLGDGAATGGSRFLEQQAFPKGSAA